MKTKAGWIATCLLGATLAVGALAPAAGAAEVAVEKECIRLLALYQPTAVDLWSLCFVIKANNDLERIADKAATIGRRVRHLVADDIDLATYPEWRDLVALVTERLDQTLRAISSRNLQAAEALVSSDAAAEEAYRRIARHIIARAREAPGGVDMAVTLTLLVRAVHRIGELCTNIAELEDGQDDQARRDEIRKTVDEVVGDIGPDDFRLYWEGDWNEKITFKWQYDWADSPVVKDLYLELKQLPIVGNLRMGHFKKPFGLEELTSSKYDTFIEQASTSVFVPSRNAGVFGPFHFQSEYMTSLVQMSDDVNLDTTRRSTAGTSRSGTS